MLRLWLLTVRSLHTAAAAAAATARKIKELNGIKTQLKIKTIKYITYTHRHVYIDTHICIWTTMAHGILATRWQVDGWLLAAVAGGPDSTQFVHLTAFIFIIFTFASRFCLPARSADNYDNNKDTLSPLSVSRTQHTAHRMLDQHTRSYCCCCPLHLFLLSLLALQHARQTCYKLYNKLLLVNASEGNSCILLAPKKKKTI